MLLDDDQEQETGPRLPRQDIPMGMIHEINGQFRKKNAIRSVVGRTNKNNQGASLNQSHSSFYQQRASSSMSQRDFMNSTLNGFGSERSFSPNMTLRSQQRSLTPQSFWYGASTVGPQASPMDRQKPPKVFAASDAIRDVSLTRLNTAPSPTGEKPKVMNPTEILKAYNERARQGPGKSNNSKVAQSIVGSIPAADGSTIDSLPHHREAQCEIPRSQSVPLEFQSVSAPDGRVMSVTSNHLNRSVASSSVPGGSNASVGSQKGNLLSFLRSESGIDGKKRKEKGTLPTIEHNKPLVRGESTTYPNTLPHTQAAKNASAYTDERSRFDANSRGLAYPAQLQLQKLAQQSHFEVRAKRHQDNFSRVSTSCADFDQRLERKKESRILHKAEVMRQQKRQLDEADKRRMEKGQGGGPTTTVER